IATLKPNADLAPGVVYTAAVKGGSGGVKDVSGNTLAVNRTWSFTTSTAAVPVGGLGGQYYDNQDLTTLKVTRTDPVVNFNWGTGSPDPTIGADSFSVRWTGQVRRTSLKRTPFTPAATTVRLWVNDNLIINNWTIHAVTENKATVALTAGQWYNITLEYYDGTGSAVISLSYSSPSVPESSQAAHSLR
ncbi:MAG: PA14 domain-containing protein, partial [Chloroflexia bacterium]